MGQGVWGTRSGLYVWMAAPLFPITHACFVDVFIGKSACGNLHGNTKPICFPERPEVSHGHLLNHSPALVPGGHSYLETLMMGLSELISRVNF